MASMRTLSVLLAAALLTAACGTKVVNPVSGETERSVMDEKSEIAEGKKAHEEVMKEFGGPLANPKLQAYVNDIGQRLAKQSHRANLTWTFTVLDSPDVNAFALPGGYVYVTRGIMAYMDSEADLAGVIGHEIGHVTARHGAQRATKQQRAGAGVMAATVLGVLVEAVTGVQGAAQAANQVSTGMAAGSIASYSRDQELQADKLGAEYLSRVGYNPKNMVDVIGVLKDQERFAADNARAAGKKAPEGGNWLASHPTNDQRLQQITAIAASYKDKGTYADDARGRYYQAIEGITYGESREQGVVRGQNFYHEPLGLALTAPTGWSFDNNADELYIINPQGDAAARRDFAQRLQGQPGPHRAQSDRRLRGDLLRRPASCRAEPGAAARSDVDQRPERAHVRLPSRRPRRSGLATQPRRAARSDCIVPCLRSERPRRGQAVDAAHREHAVRRLCRTGAPLAARRAGRAAVEAAQRRLRQRLDCCGAAGEGGGVGVVALCWWRTAGGARGES
jgi:predicted Zn-dependent protease